MPVNPIKRKTRNAFLLGILTMLLVAIVAGVILFIVLIKPNMEETKKAEEQVVAYVYRLKTGINVESGKEITSDMVESVEIPINTVATDFITAKVSNDKGKTTDIPFVDGYKAKVLLTEGTILTYSMLYEDEKVTDSLRLMEYNMLTLPIALNVGDYVDVRLRLPNGQDLIVISKKEIKDIYGQTVSMNLKEEEILVLNSAIVEAYIMNGSAELYVAKYVEPGMQQAAVYTYMPTNEVITLINTDENIVSRARNELANLYIKEGVMGVRGQVNNSLLQYSASSKENIEQGIAEQIEAAKKAREAYLSGLEGY